MLENPLETVNKRYGVHGFLLMQNKTQNLTKPLLNRLDMCGCKRKFDVYDTCILSVVLLLNANKRWCRNYHIVIGRERERERERERKRQREREEKRRVSV